MAKKIGRHFFISGEVQGVWFCTSTITVATQLGINGWVENMPDGRVGVLAFGDANQLAQLRKWLSYGPPLAKVEGITQEDIPWQDIAGFHLK